MCASPRGILSGADKVRAALSAACQIKNNAELYEAERIENMVQTPEGREKLDKLASLAFALFQVISTPPKSKCTAETKR